MFCSFTNICTTAYITLHKTKKFNSEYMVPNQVTMSYESIELCAPLATSLLLLVLGLSAHWLDCNLPLAEAVAGQLLIAYIIYITQMWSIELLKKYLMFSVWKFKKLHHVTCHVLCLNKCSLEWSCNSGFSSAIEQWKRQWSKEWTEMIQ